MGKTANRIKDEMGSLHLESEGIMEMIHSQMGVLKNDNREPKFIIMSWDIYEKMCHELADYHRYPMHPIEYWNMQIIIDTYAAPTTLRVLVGVPEI